MRYVSLIVGVLLIIGGIAYFSMGGFTYTKEEKILDVGPVEATAQRKHHIPFSPVVGGAIILGGVVLTVVGLRK